MAFARLETAILNHKKFAPLVRANGGLEALGLWTLMLLYSVDQLSDGRVPKAWLRDRCAGVRQNTFQRSAERLVAAGLVEDQGEEYVVHDYLQWNPSSTQIKSDREAARDRMKRLRGSPARSPEQTSPVRPNTETCSRQDVDVAKTKNTPPRTAAPVRANSKPHQTRDGFPFFDWPDAAAQAAYTRGATHWLPGRLPFGAFHHDCPEPSWRGLCVRADYAAQHPGAFPASEDGSPKQCAEHRGLKPAW